MVVPGEVKKSNGAVSLVMAVATCWAFPSGISDCLERPLPIEQPARVVMGSEFTHMAV